MSKIIERIVKVRLTDHLPSNNLLNPHQSGYCKHQSTETALLYIHDHIIIIFFSSFSFLLPTSTKPRAWKLSKNNGCDDFLFGRCSLCWGRRPHSPAAELWTGVETEKLFLWCPEWWLWCVCHLLLL